MKKKLKIAIAVACGLVLAPAVILGFLYAARWVFLTQMDDGVRALPF